MPVVFLDGTLENLKWLKEQVGDRFVFASFYVDNRRHKKITYGARIQTWNNEGSILYTEEVFKGETSVTKMTKSDIEHLTAKLMRRVRGRLKRILDGIGFTYKFGDIIDH